MRDIYLALSTFAFGEAMQWVFANWDSVNSGSNGYQMAPANFIGIPLVSDSRAYPVVVIITTAVLWGAVMRERTQMGSAFRAERACDMAAPVVGVNSTNIKLEDATFSATYESMEGW